MSIFYLKSGNMSMILFSFQVKITLTVILFEVKEALFPALKAKLLIH